jgi:2-acylglycerol O-acyltransferase 2
LYTLYDDLDGSGDIIIDDKINHQTSASVLDYSATPLWSMAGTIVSVFQKFARESFGVAVPLFSGRSVFFKSLGVMPRRRPVVVVVGNPIPPPTLEELGNNHQSSEAGVVAATAFHPKIDRATDQPLNEHGRILIEWHSKYVLALEELYHEYKDAPWNSPGKRRQDSMRIVR